MSVGLRRSCFDTLLLGRDLRSWTSTFQVLLIFCKTFEYAVCPVTVFYHSHMAGVLQDMDAGNVRYMALLQAGCQGYGAVLCTDDK